MRLNPTVARVTERIVARSRRSRQAYLERIARAARTPPARAHLSCAGAAHAYAAAPAADKTRLAESAAPNLGIVTAHNDMLSAHQPFGRFPELIRSAARNAGATAQIAAGVPAMCDGVTQGAPGMELSLFSRDVIAMAAAIGLSHGVFDAALFLGVCDKIVPGLVIAAQSFGHLPAVFLPAGPMPSGLSNAEKARIRADYAEGRISREELLRAEMAAYHAPGTCTFYGTANTNQMLMEVMGLHLPGASFVNPDTPLRDALTAAGTERAVQMVRGGGSYTPVAEILDERAFVNGIVGLHATGGSTNLLIHLVAMARAGGILLEWRDFAELSQVVPLLARVYPNGLADVNAFHEQGGLAFVIAELLGAGLLHSDTRTVAGTGLEAYCRVPVLTEGGLEWRDPPARRSDPAILRPAAQPFMPTGGLAHLSGNLGDAVIKVSAVAPEHRRITAPARVFHDQESVKAAFRAGELSGDLVIVVRFQGPRAAGMPELHSLTPLLSILQGRGQKVALLTDGRMSGASGKVPAAIHLSPEALDGGPIARLRDGDMIRLDAEAGVLEVLDDISARPPATADLSAHETGFGRELFAHFRRAVGPAAAGASVFFAPDATTDDAEGKDATA